jgi:hypothetical protein
MIEWTLGKVCGFGEWSRGVKSNLLMDGRRMVFKPKFNDANGTTWFHLTISSAMELTIAIWNATSIWFGLLQMLFTHFLLYWKNNRLLE